MSNRDRGKPHGFAPPTPPGIRITYLGGSVDWVITCSFHKDSAVPMPQSIGLVAQTQGPGSGLVARVRVPILPYSMQGLGLLPVCAAHDSRLVPIVSKDNSEDGVSPMNPALSISICFHRLQSTPSILPDTCAARQPLWLPICRVSGDYAAALFL